MEIRYCICIWTFSLSVNRSDLEPNLVQKKIFYENKKIFEQTKRKKVVSIATKLALILTKQNLLCNALSIHLLQYLYKQTNKKTKFNYIYDKCMKLYENKLVLMYTVTFSYQHICDSLKRLVYSFLQPRDFRFR